MPQNKSLEELENDYWGEPPSNVSVVVEYHRLRKVPISKLRAEDLILLIGEDFHMGKESRFVHLVPAALDILENDPFASGDLYKGELLSIVLDVPKKFWANTPSLNNRVVKIGEEVLGISETIGNDLLPKLSRFKYAN